jgi:hypothetical protein
MFGERGAKAGGTGEAKKENDRSTLASKKAVGCGGVPVSSGPAKARLGTDENGSESESESAANGARVGSERGSEL